MLSDNFRRERIEQICWCTCCLKPATQKRSRFSKEVLHEITEYKWLACSIDVKIGECKLGLDDVQDEWFYHTLFRCHIPQAAAVDFDRRYWDDREENTNNRIFSFHDESHQIGLALREINLWKIEMHNSTRHTIG